MSLDTAAGGAAITRREFSMSELVERTGVASATVRYYLSEGLLPAPTRKAANRFLYDERHVEVIRLIRLLQERRGLTLEAIGRVLPELFPDLVGQPRGGVFRPEMWGQVLEAHARLSGPSVRERILESGLSAFAEHGYGDVSIDDVCRAAGVAKGSFYRYFPSKEELFFAAAAAAGATLVASLDTLAGVEGEVLTERLAGLVAPYLVVFLDLASLAAQRRPGHPAALDALLGKLAEALDRALGGVGENAAEALVELAVVRAVHRIALEGHHAASRPPGRR